MLKSLSKNVSPGTWLRTSKAARQFDPDGLFRCKEIVWGGDYNPGNKIILDCFYDYETGEYIDSYQEWDVIIDMGLRPNEFEWEEGMAEMEVYESERELLKDMIEDPLK